MKVARMLPPEEYDSWQEEGMAMGFKYVASGPLVRSSYKAGEVFMETILKERDAADERKRIDGRRETGVRREQHQPTALPRSVVWSPDEAEARAARVLAGAGMSK